MGGPGLRFVLEAAFLIVLAVAAGVAELRATTIVLVMAAAWLLVAAIEWLAWRESPVFTRAGREEQPEVEQPEVPAPPRGRRFWRRKRSDGGSAEPVAVPSAQAAEPGEDTQDLDAPAERTGT